MEAELVPCNSGELTGMGDGRSPGRRWTEAEHAQLEALVKKYGDTNSWTLIARFMPNRTGKQCRQRWVNTNRSGEQRKTWEPEEEEMIAQLHAIHGPAWSAIARQLPGGRTENQVKNKWNTLMRSKFLHTHTDSVLAMYVMLVMRDNHLPNQATLAMARERVASTRARHGDAPVVKHVVRRSRSSGSGQPQDSTASGSAESVPESGSLSHANSPSVVTGATAPVCGLPCSSPVLPQPQHVWAAAVPAIAPEQFADTLRHTDEMAHMAAAAAALLHEEEGEEEEGQEQEQEPAVAQALPDVLRPTASAPPVFAVDMHVELESAAASAMGPFLTPQGPNSAAAHHLPHHHVPGRSATWQADNFRNTATECAPRSHDPLSLGVSLARQRALQRLQRLDGSAPYAQPHAPGMQLQAVGSSTAELTLPPAAASAPVRFSGLGIDSSALGSFLADQACGWAAPAAPQSPHLSLQACDRAVGSKRGYAEGLSGCSDSPTSEISTTSKRMHFTLADVPCAMEPQYQVVLGLGSMSVLGGGYAQHTSSQACSGLSTHMNTGWGVAPAPSVQQSYLWGAALQC